MEDYDGFDYDLQRKREIEKRSNFEEQWKKHVNFKKYQNFVLMFSNIIIFLLS